MNFSLISGLSATIATIATAVATVLLWRVTRVLAEETKRLANATGQPQIVATIRPNQWTIMYADIIVTNTGNSTAFDITVSFDPPIKAGHDGDETENLPFQHISILRPGESLSSDIGKAYPLLEQHTTVTTSWLRDPASLERESLSYNFTFGDLKGASQLGAASPLVQIADEVKRIREDWRSVANGNRKLRTEIFTSSDRHREREEYERRRTAMMEEIEHQKQEEASGSVSEESDRTESE